MNLGAIYTAPWGRYVVHSLSPLVLRDLERSGAYVLPCAGSEAYVATGETSTPNLGPAEHALGRSRPDGQPQPERAGLGTGTRCGDPWWMEFVRAPAHPMAPLTLGGIRSGTGYGVIPGKPRLIWSPCVVRDAAGEAHVWYLAMSSDQSLRCWECRVGRPTYRMIPKGTQPELERVWPTEADVVARAAALSVAAPAAPPKTGKFSPPPPPPLYEKRGTDDVTPLPKGKSFESAGTPVGDSPGPAHAVGGGHDRSGESPAAGNVAEPQTGSAGSAVTVTRALTSPLVDAVGHPLVLLNGILQPRLLTDDEARAFLWPSHGPPLYSPKTEAEWDEEFCERAAIYEYLGTYTKMASETSSASSTTHLASNT